MLDKPSGASVLGRMPSWGRGFGAVMLGRWLTAISSTEKGESLIIKDTYILVHMVDTELRE